ncbi:MAG: HNH endonuclease [Acidimicrobiales bacterium]
MHVDEQVRGEPSAIGCAHIEGLGAIAGHTAQRLACEGSVSRLVFCSDGSIEAEGARRVVPPAMRRALAARDRGCRWPGCTTRRHLHAHHVVFWSKGGRTALSNLVTLCGAHHRFVHEGGWDLHLERCGALRVVSPQGEELPAVPSRSPVQGDGLVELNGRRGLEIDDETLCYGGERFDLGLTVDGLLSVTGRSDYRVAASGP